MIELNLETEGFETNTVTQSGGGSSIDPARFRDWDEYLWNLAGGEGKKDKDRETRLVKKLTLSACVGKVFHAGTQEQAPARFVSKKAVPLSDRSNCFEVVETDEGVVKLTEENRADGNIDWYTKEEFDHCQRFKTNTFFWAEEDGQEVRKCFSPSSPAPVVLVFLDIPDIMVDYSKSPFAKEGAEEDLRPLRLCTSGDFWDRGVNNGEGGKVITRAIPLITDKNGNMRDSNTLYKICDKSGRLPLLEKHKGNPLVVQNAVFNVVLRMTKEVKDSEKVYYSKEVRHSEFSSLTDVKFGGNTISVDDQSKDVSGRSPSFEAMGTNTDNYTEENMFDIYPWMWYIRQCEGYDTTKLCGWLESKNSESPDEKEESEGEPENESSVTDGEEKIENTSPEDTDF